MHMTRQCARAGVILLLILGWVFAAAAQFANPDLQSGRVVVHKVLILPPLASVTKAGMKGNESLIPESNVIAGALPDIVAEAVKAKGCTVVDNPFTAAAFDKNPDLKDALADIQSKFDALHKHIAEKPKDVRKGRFTMGDEVANFNSGAAADALVFVRASGVVHTGGEKVLGAIAGVNERDFIVVDVALVDSQSGAVLYYGWSVTVSGFIENPERMKKPMESSLKEWKLATPK
jgi:hypothetical protein